jgi:hypothetical protein
MARMIAALLTALLVVGQIAGALAQTPSAASGLPPVGTKIALNFRTSVQTQGNTTTATGTVTITRSAANELTITLAPDGGTAQTLHVVLNADGTYALAPDSAAMMSANTDPQQKAAAKALFGRLALAAKIASNVQKLQGQGSFDVAYNLTPIGVGTPIPTTIHMTPGAASDGGVVYGGQAQGDSVSTLPSSNAVASKNKKMATTGLALIVSLALSPVAGLVIHVGSRIQQRNIKKALAGPLPVSMQLVVSGHFTPGPTAQISGTQYDTVSVKGHKETITTTWSFATQ